jgi:hypothetical protein
MAAQAEAVVVVEPWAPRILILQVLLAETAHPDRATTVEHLMAVVILRLDPVVAGAQVDKVAKARQMEWVAQVEQAWPAT